MSAPDPGLGRASTQSTPVGVVRTMTLTSISNRAGQDVWDGTGRSEDKKEREVRLGRVLNVTPEAELHSRHAKETSKALSWDLLNK